MISNIKVLQSKTNAVQEHVTNIPARDNKSDVVPGRHMGIQGNPQTTVQVIFLPLE
jgi:hypothetical protein